MRLCSPDNRWVGSENLFFGITALPFAAWLFIFFKMSVKGFGMHADKDVHADEDVHADKYVHDSLPDCVSGRETEN